MSSSRSFRSRWTLAAFASALAAALSGCAASPPAEGSSTQRADVVDVKLIAFNDLHGNLEPPHMFIRSTDAQGRDVQVPAGGAAYLASAIAALKAQNPRHAVVSAGDMIGASPLVSALFLDEPTIEAVNAMGIDFNAVGNHEFDKGRAELLRMQQGGCEKHTARQPCQSTGQFEGARFGFLAANVLREDGQTLFPATGIKRFDLPGGGQVSVAFIGMTLKGTPTMVSPSGVAGLRFADEADTANALVAQLKAQGADAIVVLIHQGVTTRVGYNDSRCTGMAGELLPILDRLSPQVDVVVSGHTHQAYVCDYGKVNPARPFLVTSAGLYGTLVTDIDISIDTRTRRVVARRADNRIVQGEAFARGTQQVALSPDHPRYAKEAAVDALVTRYASLAAPLAQRVVGRLSAPATRRPTASRETVLGNLIADAQLAATRAPSAGNARIALTNLGGLRADLVPAADGTVQYGQLFSAQPFGNHLVVKTFTGAQLKAVLEQQFASGSNTVESPRVLQVSQGFGYRYDLSKPQGQRISGMTLEGRPIGDADVLRIAMNSFLADGGDNFTLLREGRDAMGGGQDLDALEAYVQAGSPLALPATGRVINATPGRKN